MRINDGGGSAPQTATTGSDAPAVADRPSATTTKDVSTQTAFDRTPDTSDDQASIRDAIRNVRRREQAPTAAPAPSSSEADVAADAKARRGRTTANNGRADQPLDESQHVGSRDERIEQLKQKRAALLEEQASIAQEIDQVQDKIETKSSQAGIVGTITNVASAGVGAIFGLFGKSNPIADAATSVTESVLGVDDDRSELEDQRKALEQRQDELRERKDQLHDARVLNFLASVAHTTNMPKSVADVLEGDGDVDFEFADESALGSDAAYNSDDKKIVIDGEVADQTDDVLETLQEQGIVDDDGNIVDAKAFDKSSAGDKAIGATTLVGVHEVTHASQDQKGKIERTRGRVGLMLMDANRIAHGVGGPDAEAIRSTARRKAELERIDKLEYAAYTNQETIELQAGKKKKLFTTITPDGKPLPRQQAVENIYALQNDEPMVYGVSAGVSALDVMSADEDDENTQSASEIPGRYTPGRYTPGRYTPGRYTPGLETPGRYTPGRYTPGLETPGRYTPGHITG